MDDDRIERALRLGPPHEPDYEPTFRSARPHVDEPGPMDVVFRAGGRRRGVASRVRLDGLRLGAGLVAAVVLVAVALTLRPATDDRPGASASADVLARIRESRVLRVAVTTGHPQTTAGGGSLIGFDVDVAKALAGQLGVRDSVSGLAPAEISSGQGGWDVALPSTTVRSGDLTNGPVYSAWPSWLAVASDSPAATRDDLAGAVVCAVVGTAGEAWLAGTLAPGQSEIAPPDGSRLLKLASDAECATAVEHGDAQAAVTATVLDDELGQRGLRALLPDPVILEERRVVVRGNGQEVQGLVGALDSAVGELVRSGRLAELSRESFGGRDLTGGVR